MKIPSINALLTGAKRTFIRFPFVILLSSAGAFILGYIIHLDKSQASNTQYLYNAAMACSLGIPLLISFSFITERYRSSRAVNIIVQITGIMLLTAYFISLPADKSYVDITRYILLNYRFTSSCFIFHIY